MSIERKKPKKEKVSQLSLQREQALAKVKMHYKGKTPKKVLAYLDWHTRGENWKEVAKLLKLEVEKMSPWDARTDIDIKIIEDCDLEEADWVALTKW